VKNFLNQGASIASQKHKKTGHEKKGTLTAKSPKADDYDIRALERGLEKIDRS